VLNKLSVLIHFRATVLRMSFFAKLEVL